MPSDQSAEADGGQHASKDGDEDTTEDDDEDDEDYDEENDDENDQPPLSRRRLDSSSRYALVSDSISHCCCVYANFICFCFFN